MIHTTLPMASKHPYTLCFKFVCFFSHNSFSQCLPPPLLLAKFTKYEYAMETPSTPTPKLSSLTCKARFINNFINCNKFKFHLEHLSYQSIQLYSYYIIITVHRLYDIVIINSSGIMCFSNCPSSAL